MAISTVDDLVAGFKAPVFFYKDNAAIEATTLFHSLLYTDGQPAAAASPSGNGLSGVALTSYPGQIPYDNAGSGANYLGRFEASVGSNCELMLLDRLWHNDSIVLTTTTAQTINSVTLPPRDNNGSTDGEGVYAALEVSSALGNSIVPLSTISYTNSAGVSGRTGTIQVSSSSLLAGAFLPFALQAGDTGVRSIQSLTLISSLVSGTAHLVMYRHLAQLQIKSLYYSDDLDFIKTGLIPLYDNTVPFLVGLFTSGAFLVSGSMTIVEG